MPTKNYSQIPNDLILSDLSPALFKAWCQLASVMRDGRSVDFARGLADVAQEVGIDPRALRKTVQRLKQAGAATIEEGNLHLLVPTAESIKEAEELSISNEVDEKPNRKHAMTQEEAWELVKKGWNENKPDTWMRLDGRFNLPLMIAIETHTKRHNINREDYAAFIGKVCRGGGVDPWWSRQDMKPSSIFGWGKATDKKFANVDKLAGLGAKVRVKMDFADDAEILRRYAGAGKDFDSVVRVHYNDENDMVKVNNEAREANPTAAILMYGPDDTDRPSWWSFCRNRDCMYIFD